MYIVYLVITENIVYIYIVPKPTITLTGTGNQTVGDELSLRCDVNLSKGISGSVNFVWKINNTEVELHNMSFPLSNTSALYTDFLNISSLNLTDNNAVYQCQAEIVTSHSVNLTVSINLTLNVTGKKLCNTICHSCYSAIICWLTLSVYICDYLRDYF